MAGGASELGIAPLRGAIRRSRGITSAGQLSGILPNSGYPRDAIASARSLGSVESASTGEDDEEVTLKLLVWSGPMLPGCSWAVGSNRFSLSETTAPV